ncbi:MAG: hypothetical protein RMJ66_08430 [Bacteroidia bacterium]|nr:hypothetical protein [Bacteroidia bacterium]MDW8135074.1 hypothetical protein [Bacteroidia bacterium]
MKQVAWLGVVGFLLSCSREIPLPQYEEGQVLFPVEEGRNWVYEVRETTYTTLGSVPNRYFLRVRIDTPTIDAYRRNCFYVVWDTTSSLEQAKWGFLRVGLIYQDSIQTELWEDNRRYLLLRFPLSPVIRWNRNEYTDLPPEICRYHTLDTVYSLEANSFSHSVIVLRRLDTLGLLRKALHYEVYTRGLGLIHRYERLDAYNLSPNGVLTRSTDSYHRELRLYYP